MKQLILCLLFIIGGLNLKAQTPTINVLYHCIYNTKQDSLLMIKTLENIKEFHEDFNKSFKGKINFEEAPILLIHKDTLTIQLIFYSLSIYYDMSVKYCVPGFYNVFLMPTSGNMTEGVLAATPYPITGYNGGILKELSPYYDVCVIGYEGMAITDKGSILSHETGHWLGLSHVYELNIEQLHLLGVYSFKDFSENYMNYGWFICRFTPQQLDFMLNFAQSYRNYLIK